MTRPGVDVRPGVARPRRGVPTDTGAGFLATTAYRGPADEAVEITSLDSFVARFGGRETGYTAGYDAVEAFFAEGGSTLHVARVVGPAAATATATLDDASTADSLRVDAYGPGAWGNGLAVTVVAGDTAGTYRLVVTSGGDVLERSPSLATPTDAAEWSARSRHVRIVALGEGNPAPVEDAVLAGGDDDRAAITDDEWQTALELFGDQLGPGQVFAPGRSTEAGHAQLVAHAAATNRVALLDAPDGSDVAGLRAVVDAVAGLANADVAAVFAPWHDTSTGTRQVKAIPPSPIVAGLIARSDAASGSANIIPAGENGRSRASLGLRDTFTDADLAELYETGVNLFRKDQDGVLLYGFRAATNDEVFRQFNYARLRMQLTAQLRNVASTFVFRQIDGRGQLFAEFAGALTAALAGLYAAGSLYGETPDEAFFVDTSEGVNTPETVADGQLRARVGYRPSPGADWVVIDLVQYPTDRPLAA